jgi:hypothetical protein
MSINANGVLALIAFSISTLCPTAFAQTTPNSETIGSPSVNVPRSNLTREQRRAAAAERRAAGAQIAKERVTDPTNNQAGQYGVTTSSPKPTTREERVAARKERRAVGEQVTKENIKNPPNYEAGKPAINK